MLKQIENTKFDHYTDSKLRVRVFTQSAFTLQIAYSETNDDNDETYAADCRGREHIPGVGSVIVKGLVFVDIQTAKPLGKQTLTVFRAALARGIRVASIANIASVELVVYSVRLIGGLRRAHKIHWLGYIPMQRGVTRRRDVVWKSTLTGAAPARCFLNR
jgi:hypothetical protein